LNGSGQECVESERGMGCQLQLEGVHEDITNLVTGGVGAVEIIENNHIPQFSDRIRIAEEVDGEIPPLNEDCYSDEDKCDENIRTQLFTYPPEYYHTKIVRFPSRHKQSGTTKK